MTSKVGLTKLSDPDDEAMIDKAMYKGKELFLNEDKHQSRAREASHFRLMDLPAELRVNIYEHLLPCNKVLKLKQQPRKSWQRYSSAMLGKPITDAPE
jgi:hypothetical protein